MTQSLEEQTRQQTDECLRFLCMKKILKVKKVKVWINRSSSVPQETLSEVMITLRHHVTQWCAQGGPGGVAPRSWANCWKMHTKVPSWEPKKCAKQLAKHTKLPLGWLKHDKLSSREPKHALKFPLGSQNTHSSSLLGAKMRAKVPFFSPLPFKKSAHATDVTHSEYWCLAASLPGQELIWPSCSIVSVAGSDMCASFLESTNKATLDSHDPLCFNQPNSIRSKKKSLRAECDYKQATRVWVC